MTNRPSEMSNPVELSDVATPMKVHHIRNLVSAAVLVREFGREEAIDYLVARHVQKGYLPEVAKQQVGRYLGILDSEGSRVKADNSPDLICSGCNRHSRACDGTAVIDELLLYKLPISVGETYSVSQLVRDLEHPVMQMW